MSGSFRHGRRIRSLLTVAPLIVAVWLGSSIRSENTPAAQAAVAATRLDAALSASSGITLDKFVYLPIVLGGGPDACPAIPAESYDTLSVNPPPTDRPAEIHADLNLGFRGYTPTSAYLGLVDIGGPSDPSAPQFISFFNPHHAVTFSSADEVYNWSWVCNCRTTPDTSPAVTLLGMPANSGTLVHVPASGYDIGGGYSVLVLYAAPSRITLKYTRDDNVISGYTIHVENVCVEPRLLTLYQTWNSAGRSQLPALRSGQAIGTATSAEVSVAIQDSGMWMDPRSRKDWWQGQALAPQRAASTSVQSRRTTSK